MNPIEGIAQGAIDPWVEITTSDEESMDDAVDLYIDAINDLYDRSAAEWDYHIRRVSEYLSDLRTYEGVFLTRFMDGSADRVAAWAAILSYRNLMKGRHEIAIDTLSTLPANLHDDVFAQLIRCKALLQKGTKQNIQASLESLFLLLNEADDHAEIHHLIALAIVVATENRHRLTSKYLPVSHTAQLRVALYHVNEAVNAWDGFFDLAPVAEIYATKGRILTQLELYDDAIQVLMDAIDAENTIRKNSNKRISEYQRHLLWVEIDHQKSRYDTVRERTNQLATEVEELIERTESVSEDIDGLDESLDGLLREFQNRTVQFLGFFAALLGAIVISADITTSYSFEFASGLILVIIGGIVGSFGSLNYLLLRGEESPPKLRHQVAPILLSISLILLGILLPLVVYPLFS